MVRVWKEKTHRYAVTLYTCRWLYRIPTYKLKFDALSLPIRTTFEWKKPSVWLHICIWGTVVKGYLNAVWSRHPDTKECSTCVLAGEGQRKRQHNQYCASVQSYTYCISLRMILSFAQWRSCCSSQLDVCTHTRPRRATVRSLRPPRGSCCRLRGTCASASKCMLRGEGKESWAESLNVLSSSFSLLCLHFHRHAEEAS